MHILNVAAQAISKIKMLAAFGAFMRALVAVMAEDMLLLVGNLGKCFAAFLASMPFQPFVHCILMLGQCT